MSIRKLLLLSSMALAAIAFAVPASASAEWLYEGKGFSGETEVSASGPAQFNTFLGGVSCESADAIVTLEGGTTTGTADVFHADHDSNCHGSGGLANCTVVTSALTGTPVFETNGEDVRATNVTLWAEYETTEGAPEECAVEETELDFENANGQYITGTPDPNKNEVESLTLSAPAGGILTAFGLEVPGVEVEATMTLDAEHAGKLGV